jgi:hypothetical protein
VDVQLGCNAAHYAVAKNRPDLVTWLVQHGIDINQPNQVLQNETMPFASIRQTVCAVEGCVVGWVGLDGLHMWPWVGWHMWPFPFPDMRHVWACTHSHIACMVTSYEASAVCIACMMNVGALSTVVLPPPCFRNLNGHC